MDCTPATLARQAACYACLPKDRMRALLVYLLAQWANQQSGVQDFLVQDDGDYILLDDGGRIIIN